LIFLSTTPENLEAGDLVLFTLAKNPQHVGIIGNHPQGGLGIIRALQSSGCVCWHAFNKIWTIAAPVFINSVKKRLIVSALLLD
jgi:hypothetical protein